MFERFRQAPGLLHRAHACTVFAAGAEGHAGGLLTSVSAVKQIAIRLRQLLQRRLDVVGLVFRRFQAVHVK